MPKTLKDWFLHHEMHVFHDTQSVKSIGKEESVHYILYHKLLHKHLRRFTIYEQGSVVDTLVNFKTV